MDSWTNLYAFLSNFPKFSKYYRKSITSAAQVLITRTPVKQSVAIALADLHAAWNLPATSDFAQLCPRSPAFDAAAYSSCLLTSARTRKVTQLNGHLLLCDEIYVRMSSLRTLRTERKGLASPVRSMR
jgi:hypothetical protein